MLLHGYGRDPAAPEEVVNQAEKGAAEIFSAVLVGEIYPGSAVEKAAATYGYPYLLEPLEPFLARADFATGGLTPAEAPAPAPLLAAPTVSAAGYHQAAAAKPDTVAEVLKMFNFNAVALSYPDGGAAQPLEQVLRELSRAGVDAVGAGADFDQARAISYSDAGGMRVAVLGFSEAVPLQEQARPDQGGLLPADPNLYLPLTREAGRNADLVIVHIHWRSWEGGTPQPRQADLAKALADAGADLVIGHLPHHVGPVEEYNGSLIFYSLGSLISDRTWASTSRLAAAARYTLFEDGTASVQLIPLWVREGRPHPITGDSFLDRSRRAQIFSRLAGDGSSVEQAVTVHEGAYLYLAVDHSHLLKEGAGYAGQTAAHF
jgi:poly-gamma-glutamate synthesis protein (capsule biosynthesis protein)